MVALQARALRAAGHEVTLLDAAGWRGLGRPEGWECCPFDAVMVHNVMTMPFDLAWRRELLTAARCWPGCGWVNWVHDLALCNPAYATMSAATRRELEEVLPPFVTVVVSQARRREYAERMGVAEAEVRVVPNGLDLDEWMGGEMGDRWEKWGIWKADLVLLHPARWVRRKRIEFSVEVAAALRDLGWDVRLLLTAATDPHQADGAAYAAEVQGLVRERDLSEVVVGATAVGQELTDVEVAALYRAADVLLFPSTSEGFGLPVIEAMAARLAVWCTDLPVLREVAGPGTTFFSLKTPPQEVAAALAEVAEKAGWRERRRCLEQLDFHRLCKERLEPVLAAAIRGK